MAGYGPPGSPPPPGGYGAPQGGGYGPPPGGGYGPPPNNPGPGGYGAPSSGGGVNLSAVNPFDWAAIAAGVLALIFSFFKFYDYKPKGAEADAACKNPSGPLKDVCDGIDNSAWHGFFGWFGVLLALIGAILVAVAVFVPRLSLPVPARVIALGAFAVGFLSVLIALFVVPDGEYMGRTIDAGSSDTDAGHSFSYWIVLILVLVGAVVTFLSFQKSGGSLSNLTGSRGGSGQHPGGFGPGYAGPQGPPASYGQQPPQGPPPGYGAPQGPPPGYGQQGPQGPQGPPPGYGQQGPQAPPPGYGQQGPQAPPPGYGQQGSQGPPPGYGQQGSQGPPPGYGQQGPPPGYGQ